MVEQKNKDKIIGESKHIRDVREQIELAAKCDSSVLIQGPTGTGKELIANNIHKKSKRKRKSFEVVNCGAIPTELFESELFGHKRGAFTGATADKSGKVDAANGGTLFLDEIGDLRLDHQVKILRFLQDGSYTPVGDTNTKESKVRIIAATNKDLLEEIEAGAFREDLYFRLYEHDIYTLPLVKRSEDVICFVNHFSKKSRLKIEDFKIRFLLYSYKFPGNVRELKSAFSVYDYTTIANKMWRSVSNRAGKDANPPLGFDPDDYNMSFDNIKWKLPGSPKTKEEFKQQDYEKYKSALHFLEENSQVVEKHVRAYEIIMLYQKTQLTKKNIAQTLNLRLATLSPLKFKSTYGFDFPDRDKPYLIDSPANAYPSPRKSEYSLGDSY